MVTDLLTNPDLKSTREFYGTVKDKTLSLDEGENVGWPKDFKPDTHGYTLVKPSQDPFINQRRILAIRIDKLDLKQKDLESSEHPIEVSIFNGGGSANGGAGGGCHVFYECKKVGKRWTVEYVGQLDP